MFGLGLPEIIIILVVALLVVGPTKLPDLAKSLGRAFSDFRRMADDVKETFNEEVVKEVEDIKKIDVMSDADESSVKEPTDTVSAKEPTDTASFAGEEAVIADSQAPKSEEKEDQAPPGQLAKEEESKEQSGKNEAKAT